MFAIPIANIVKINIFICHLRSSLFITYFYLKTYYNHIHFSMFFPFIIKDLLKVRSLYKHSFVLLIVTVSIIQ